MSSAAQLRRKAAASAARLPPLKAQAQQLAATVLLGDHGRRRAGLGHDFWQFRPFQQGDSANAIDWRRSAKSEGEFVRQKEWQIAQTISLWVDGAASLRYRSERAPETKADRAQVLALAIAILMIRAGERVGLADGQLAPQRGEAQIDRLCAAMMQDQDREQDQDYDYGTPEAELLMPHSQAIFISDFLGDMGAVETALARAADLGVRGVLFQILDPAEEDFPFQGRAIFQSIGETLQHETRRATDLKSKYVARLAARCDHLQSLARASGWQYHTHVTQNSAQSALLWLYRAIEGARR